MMVLIKMFIMPALLFIGISTAFNVPRANETVPETVNGVVLPLPTSGQPLNPTQTVGANVTHALGGPPVPTATFTSVPLDWSAIITSDFSGPPPLHIGTNVTIGNSTIQNSTFLVVPPLNRRNEHLKTRGIPAMVDWRNVYGLNWITTVQYQGSCGSCWAFAATAVMETMVRIQHGMWSKRSEADLHDSMGVSCAQGGGADGAMAWAAGQGMGIADETCDPYHTQDDNYLPCADRSGRTLRVPAYTTLSDIDDQKKWIADVGPIAASLKVYTDFDSWTVSLGPYKYDGHSKYRGNHVVLVIGYDDNQGCWIIKNSWGTGWGDSGFGLIGYGEVSIDDWWKFGMTNENPDPWTRKRHHNGNMYQSGNGATHRNLELVRAANPIGFTNVFRSGEAPWSWGVASTQVAYDESGNLVDFQTVIGQPIITGTSFNRDFEVLYWAVGGYLQHWYYSQTAQSWFYTGMYGWGQIGGYPGFIQTDDSNFCIVVRNTDGSVYEWQRSASSGDVTFQRLIANDILQSGPALVQSNVGVDINDPQTMGNLYVVVVLASGQMRMFWRPGTGTNLQWISSETFGSDIPDTPPVMVQDYWRTKDETTPGGFQLCVAVNGQVQHWQRINTDIGANPPQSGQDSGPGNWQLVFTFGSNIKHVWSLIHGTNNQALELVVEDYQGNLWEWQYTGTWAPTAIVPGP